jgi:putative ABC transport system ATP-binding protein
MVTHDPVAAAYADAVLFLADGRIVGRMDRPSADAVAERLAHLADAPAAALTAGSPRAVAGAA